MAANRTVSEMFDLLRREVPDIPDSQHRTSSNQGQTADQRSVADLINSFRQVVDNASNSCPQSRPVISSVPDRHSVATSNHGSYRAQARIETPDPPNSQHGTSSNQGQTPDQRSVADLLNSFRQVVDNASNSCPQSRPVISSVPDRHSVATSNHDSYRAQARIATPDPPNSQHGTSSNQGQTPDQRSVADLLNSFRQVVDNVSNSCPQSRPVASSRQGGSQSASIPGPSRYRATSRTLDAERKAAFSPYQHRAKGSNIKKQHSLNETFHKEVILLPSKKRSRVLTPTERELYQQKELIVNIVEFSKSFSKDQVIEKLRKPFVTKLMGHGITVLRPIRSTLFEPALEFGQSLNGDILKKLFHQKPIYIRPHANIHQYCGIDPQSDDDGGEEEDPDDPMSDSSRSCSQIFLAPSTRRYSPPPQQESCNSPEMNLPSDTHEIADCQRLSACPVSRPAIGQ
nr:PREDICTED: uncharacterized protein LOC109031713 [Bemisia tabaci]